MRNAAVGPPLLTRSPFSWRKDVNLQRRLPTALWTDTGNVSLAALRNNRPIKPASERRRRRGQSPSSLPPQLAGPLPRCVSFIQSIEASKRKSDVDVQVPTPPDEEAESASL